MPLMNKIGLAAIIAFCSSSAMAFDIFALGTSNTNCHGVDRSLIFTVRLEELLRADGIDAHVINASLDGDKPAWMESRLRAGITDKTRLVIFEPGPNELNKSYNVEPSEKILSVLQAMHMPTIYVSHKLIQTNDEAEETAKKYGAYYYGHFAKDIPVDTLHRQYDKPGGGHLAAAGCLLWAKNMAPLVKRVIEEAHIEN